MLHSVDKRLVVNGGDIMRVVELQKAKLSSFMEIIENQPGGFRNVFRGQGDASWNLLPSLYRIDASVFAAASMEESYQFFESDLLHRFFDQGFPYLPPIKRGFTNDRILAQHFGVPTRLLDWTLDPLVALYFATENQSNQADAAIFMLAPDAHYKSDYLDHKAARSNSFTAALIDPPAIDRRIPAQKSVFTIQQYGPAEKEFVPLNLRSDFGGHYHNSGMESVRGFAKIVIPGNMKRYLRHLLHGAGIDQRNLFPGLDGVGGDIARRARESLL